MQYIRLLPKKTLSRLVGGLAKLEHPNALVRAGQSWFAKRYHLNEAEAEKPFDQYPSLQALFTRKLKPGLRPIGQGLVHPCDGELTQVCEIDYGQLVQTKGITYSLTEFIKDPEAPTIFKNGFQLTYYLCPTDYHRVHSPIDGEVLSVHAVPGELWPVNPWSVENISQLFCRNERVVFNLRTQVGPVSLVMIGATNVGEIIVSFDSEISESLRKTGVEFKKTYPNPIKTKKGDELGIFGMGSSVVVVYPKGAVSILPKPDAVRMGQSL